MRIIIMMFWVVHEVGLLFVSCVYIYMYIFFFFVFSLFLSFFLYVIPLAVVIGVMIMMDFWEGWPSD